MVGLSHAPLLFNQFIFALGFMAFLGGILGLILLIMVAFDTFVPKIRKAIRLRANTAITYERLLNDAELVLKQCKHNDYYCTDDRCKGCDNYGKYGCYLIHIINSSSQPHDRLQEYVLPPSMRKEGGEL